MKKRLALATLALTTPGAIAAAVLALAPSPAYAGCFGDTHSDVTMSCAVGSQWDPESKTCVVVSSTS